MIKVERIEAELKSLPTEDLKRVRDWLDDFVEDRLKFTAEFESAIKESAQEMAEGFQPRVRMP